MRKPISKPLPPSHCPHSPLSHSPTQQSQYSHLLCLLLPLLLPIPHLYISLALFRCWGKGKTVPAASSPRAAKHTCLWGLTFTAPNFVMFEFVEISIQLFTPFTRKHYSHSPLHLASLPPSSPSPHSSFFTTSSLVPNLSLLHLSYTSLVATIMASQSSCPRSRSLHLHGFPTHCLGPSLLD